MVTLHISLCIFVFYYLSPWSCKLVVLSVKRLPHNDNNFSFSTRSDQRQKNGTAVLKCTHIQDKF
jgi:hypothetical protein